MDIEQRDEVSNGIMETYYYYNYNYYSIKKKRPRNVTRSL